MKLLRSKLSKNDKVIIRTEVHEYESLEEAIKYKDQWERAGFTALHNFFDCDSVFTVYQRRLEVKSNG